MTEIEYFKARVKKTGDCHEWTGTIDNRGYGTYQFKGIRKQAHRMAHELFVEKIPPGNGYHGTVVMHRCDNRRCVNIANLSLGTNRENIQDAAEKRD